MRKRIIIPAAAVLFFLGVGIGTSGGGKTETASDSKALPKVTATVTETITARPPGRSAKVKPNPTVTVTKTAASRPKSSAAPGDSDRATVHNFVGSGLQAAQDAAQAEGFYLLKSHDSTGAGRYQVLDRSWKVCSQNLTAGKTAATDSKLDFGVVKLDEECP